MCFLLTRSPFFKPKIVPRAIKHHLFFCQQALLTSPNLPRSTKQQLFFSRISLEGKKAFFIFPRISLDGKKVFFNKSAERRPALTSPNLPRSTKQQFCFARSSLGGKKVFFEKSAERRPQRFRLSRNPPTLSRRRACGTPETRSATSKHAASTR